MRHTFSIPMTLTIKMDTPADALLIWAALGVSTNTLREMGASLKHEDARALLNQACDAHIEDSLYPIWNAVDEALRGAGLV